MSQPADVPIPPDLSRRYGVSKAGRDWLASLPRLIQHCMDQWQLELDLAPGALPGSGHGAIVVPVRHRSNGSRSASTSTRTSADNSPTDDAGQDPGQTATPAGREDAGAAARETAVLKLAYPHDEALMEPHALALWSGHGAVRMLASDAAANALLLERLDAARSLQDEPMDVAVPVWGALVRRLGLVPDGRPEWHEFSHVAARAEQWSDELPESWEQLGRPFPRWLLEAALEVCQTRGAVGRRSGRDVLVHTDLHYLNILARFRRDEPDAGGRGPADGWAAIDPQPMIGEAEFAVAPLLWNRIPELSRSDPERGLRERCRDFSLAAGLDAEVARQWSLAREVENALDYASRPRHEGDLARSLWVASTLAGRTLPDLPAPHALPAQGQAFS
ncbi:aminoglycoside phosphotransferase family protein [Arthrobacter sp. PsM3]|uniref:aminoglycoside phosphotransferase family protein n=1 Tax=Arthrobacter sp. PsM3 TaxID=3030531 RepID=UPI00263B14BB|nr:aminoglycoside phosphotransferase family protein [Arthrobacter sp. PsM3]MDN4644796.1 aminoglycoside phosphotransferase family protein [Arthrobacter sp. PsM3]